MDFVVQPPRVRIRYAACFHRCCITQNQSDSPPCLALSPSKPSLSSPKVASAKLLKERLISDQDMDEWEEGLDPEERYVPWYGERPPRGRESAES